MNMFARWCLIFFVATTVAGCGKDDKQNSSGGGGGAPAAKVGGGGGGTSCDKVANKVSFARAKHFAVGGKLPQFAAQVADSCRSNAWAEGVKSCLAGAADDAAAKACVDGADADAKAKIEADFNAALAAHGSQATW